MTQNSPISISIGIPVYNEENNISKLLGSIENQRQEKYKIDCVFVVDDCSTDKSKSEIQKYISNSKLPIKFIHLEKNFGKAKVLNIIYGLVKSEILITFDSDALFPNKGDVNNCINEWVKPYLGEGNDKIGLVCCRAKLIDKKCALSRVYNFTISYCDIIMNLIPDHPSFANGYMQIIPKKVFKNIYYPENLIRIDTFLYLWIKKHKLKFNLLESPRLCLRSEEGKGFFWYLKMQGRVNQIPQRHIDEFGKEAKKIYKYPPKSILLPAFFKALIKNPTEGLLFVVWKGSSLVFNKLIKRKIPANWRK